MGCVIVVSRLSSEVLCVLFGIFYFQAEDGIRDLVRSRGLGDVYKRQSYNNDNTFDPAYHAGIGFRADAFYIDFAYKYATPVSYTHLTLPTSDLV